MKKRVSFIIFFVCLTISIMADVKTYKFNNMFTISVSDILELRKDDDAYTRFLSDTLNYSANSEIVFQQRGLSEGNQSAIEAYCRIMIVTDIDDSGPYPCCNEDDFTDDYIQELISTCQGELVPGQCFICQPAASIRSTTNGYKYINIDYTRSGYKGAVKVNICYFNNYKYAIKAIFSYRTSESDIWQTAIRNSINSFTWIDPYFAHENLQDNDLNDESSSYIESDGSGHISYGILIGIAIMLVLVGIVYIAISYQKSNKRKVIEGEFIKLNTLVSEKKVVSAHNAIDSLKKTHGAVSNDYQLVINDIEKKSQLVKDELEHCVNELIVEAKDNLVNKGGTSLSSSSIRKFNDNQEIPFSLKEKLKEGLKLIEIDYQHGIIPAQHECYTKYKLPTCNEREHYSFYSAPLIGTVVFPYRRRKVELRGYTEATFEKQLIISFSNNMNYLILGDVSIYTAEGYHPYEPDISIIEVNNKYGIRIDIEIDEPYSGFEKTPIHYIGCGDEFRDKNLSNHGWIVIRFSERQVHKEASRCINYIRYILSLIDSDVTYINDFPEPDSRWTEIEAKKMSVNGYRENLLQHTFCRNKTEAIIQDIRQTEEEKSAASKVSPLIYPSRRPKNIDSSSKTFVQDSKLSFEPKEHIYLYDGVRSLTPVSTVVNYFFEPFDSIGLSERTAIRDRKSQCEVLEDWDCKGAESREIGTFLHSQIESYFSKKPLVDHTHFSYSGQYVRVNKDVSIMDEIRYFKNFLKENPLFPFRVEWHIYDLNLGIAGTIDLLCRNGREFDIYDWKRSRKASPDETIWRYGINGLNHIPDIGFYHYAIQQNIYRYILENNYGITVRNMYIVIFHPIYNNYRKFEIPRMEKETMIIVNYLQNHQRILLCERNTE